MNTNDAKDHAKDLLLQVFRYLTDSLWKNEQTGETRVNGFIGLVAAVLAGLAALSGSDPGVRMQWRNS